MAPEFDNKYWKWFNIRLNFPCIQNSHIHIRTHSYKLTLTLTPKQREHNGIWNRIQFHFCFSSHRIITFAFDCIVASEPNWLRHHHSDLISHLIHLTYDESGKELQMGGRGEQTNWIWVEVKTIIEANGQFIANNFSISQMFHIDRKLEFINWNTEIIFIEGK